jgi:hypothetical protein
VRSATVGLRNSGVSQLELSSSRSGVGARDDLEMNSRLRGHCWVLFSVFLGEGGSAVCVLILLMTVGLEVVSMRCGAPLPPGAAGGVACPCSGVLYGGDGAWLLERHYGV